MKTLVILFFLMLSCITLKSQNYFADYLIVGSSLTYMRFTEKDEYRFTHGYDEYTWNINAGIRLSKRFFAGIQYLNIYSSDLDLPKDYYKVYGLFTQFNFLNDDNTRLFIEASLNRGDYCLAYNLPSRVDNLNYIGFGPGVDLQIKKIPNLYFDFSFINYFIANKIKGKYSYTQYIVGLNYRFKAR